MCTKKLKVSSDMGLAVPDDEDAAVKKKRRTGTQAVRHAVDGEAEAKKRSRKRANHEKNFTWGGTKFIFKPPNSWQATCPRCGGAHENKVKKQSACRQTRCYNNDGEKQVLLCLKHWANQCMSYAARSRHQRYRPKFNEIPPEAEIERARLPEGWTSDPEKKATATKARKNKKAVVKAKAGEPKVVACASPPVAPKSASSSASSSSGTSSSTSSS